MSSVEEINELREELARRRAARKESEEGTVVEQRKVELETEAEKLRREIAEEEAIAELLAGAGQTVEIKSERTDEEILLASSAAIAIANGATQEDVNVAISEFNASKSEPVKDEPVKDEPVKAEAAKPLVPASSTVTGAAKVEEK